MSTKDKNTASVDILAEIHKLFAKYCITRLQEAATGKAGKELTPSEANVIRGFLKDNNIEATDDNEDIPKVAKELANLELSDMDEYELSQAISTLKH